MPFLFSTLHGEGSEPLESSTKQEEQQQQKLVSEHFSGALFWSASGKAEKFMRKLAKHFIVHSERWTPTKICKVQIVFTKHISRAIQALISGF